MRISHLKFPFRTLLLGTALLGLTLAVRAAQTPVAAKRAAAEPDVPKSVFHLPTSPQDPAKDPFFPQSTRLRSKPPQLISATNLPPVVVELELKGISGTADHRLAIINTRTFGVGEEGEVATSNGKARIRVVEIKSDSVVVSLNGEQRVLKLRPGL